MNRLLAAAAAALTILPLTALSAETADHVPFSELTGGSVAGTFTETRTIPGAERAFEMAGSFMTSPERLCWKMEKPFVKAWEFEDGRTTEKTPGGIVRQLGEQGPGRLIADLLSGIASGGLDAVKGDFTLASAEKTAGGWAYELAPVSAMMRKALKSVRLVTEGGRFSEFSVTDAGGGSTVMRFEGTGAVSPEQFDLEFPRFCDVH
ncbi:MAG: hypothetical protein SPL69_10035 [Succinivibrionaceae bacterium]|jgi:hypothetical protein|nr:hypothetical protein [Succinivibrionaceae bacterium]MDY6337311.1 hypothetical protein [Succinivibrionaceae bacterium]MDY6376434.1 hypothetical protein [Succinivibrionaceae bacterium]